MKRCLLLLLIIVPIASSVFPAAAQSAVVAYTTAQRFDHGLMLWRSDTGFIWVLLDDGRVYDFPLASYAALRDNPVRQSAGRIKPLFGFGKVWGNNRLVRDALGWPVMPELGFNMPIQNRDGVLYLTQSNGIVYQINPDHTWSYVTDVPEADLPSVLQFVVTPSPIRAGETIFLNWQTYGSDQALVEFVNPRDNAVVATLNDLPKSGSTSLTVPSDYPETRLDVVLYVLKRDSVSGDPQRLARTAITIQVQTNRPDTFDVPSTFQFYQNGFMAWRGDTGEIYAFYSTGLQEGAFESYPSTAYGQLPENPFTNPPAGTIRPIMGFGRLWGNMVTVRDRLGWPTGSESAYLMALTLAGGKPVAMSLPDERAIVIDPVTGSWRF